MYLLITYFIIYIQDKGYVADVHGRPLRLKSNHCRLNAAASFNTPGFYFPPIKAVVTFRWHFIKGVKCCNEGGLLVTANPCNSLRDGRGTGGRMGVL